MAKDKNDFSPQSVQRSIDRFQQRNQVNNTVAYLMIWVAALVDLSQMLISAIPYLGWIVSALISVFAWLMFWLWTSMLGWKLSDNIKALALKLIMALNNFVLPTVELIPIADILPLWTFKIFIQITILKIDDFIYNKTQGKVDLEKIALYYTSYKKVLEEEAARRLQNIKEGAKIIETSYQ